ncbi:MAG: hypothetical protein J2P25_16910, partial [Nocardiopsaceae bacterium]|nr:hypothetical protein [Nocardiopsaceae bacterium]
LEIITDHEGHAVGHGCARLIRETGSKSGSNGGLARDGPPGTGWDFTRDTARPGPDGGHGSWILTLPGSGQPGTGQPGSRRYRVEMHKIPLHECDHRYATDAYAPSDLLRHLVQVRDGECSFTGCSHNATQCDFEHTVPWHQGGATDGCNGAMRSRRCHKVKQSRGWRVTQGPGPGWHQWQAPSGRTYTKRPKQYPD